MAGLAARFTLATVSGTLVRAVTWAFHLSELRRTVARHAYPVLKDGRPVGIVTSGSYGPSVDKYIAMAYVETPLASVGTELAVEIRGQAKAARVVRTPFYASKVKKAG